MVLPGQAGDKSWYIVGSPMLPGIGVLIVAPWGTKFGWASKLAPVVRFVNVILLCAPPSSSAY